MLFAIPTHISRNVKRLGLTNGMFNARTHPRDSAILGFLFRRQLTTPRFPLGLIGLDFPRFMSLKAGVFPRLAVRREVASRSPKPGSGYGSADEFRNWPGAGSCWTAAPALPDRCL